MEITNVWKRRYERQILNIKSIFTWVTFQQGSTIHPLHIPCISQNKLCICFFFILNLWASDTFLYFVKYFKFYGQNMLATIQVCLSSLLFFNPPTGLLKWLYILLLNVSDLIFLCAHVNRQVPDADHNIKISNHSVLFSLSPVLNV